jgi:riboflavin synthase
MFTGIVQAVGSVVAIAPHGGDRRIVIDSGSLGVDDIAPGDSICVAGVCLTAVAIDGVRFCADISVETLSRTTLGLLKSGDCVNLEKSLRLADRLGGHLVAGHVDGVGRVLAIEPDARSQRWQFAVPDALARYIAEKGSVCVDGVSLTVNGVAGREFDVNLIPHTIAATTFARKQAGEAVNVEVDLIARYVERLFNPAPRSDA